MAGENKKKFALWIHPSVLEQVGEAALKDNCASQSEFIEKAVKFYLGYLGRSGCPGYLCADFVQYHSVLCSSL